MRNNYADTCAAPKFLSKLDAASNADAAVTQDADVAQFWVVDWVYCSYAGGTVTGKLTITIGGATVFETDITSTGPHQFLFDPPLYNPAETKNQALVITLGAGGSGVTGKVNARIR